MTGRLIRHELCADEWSEVAKALERDGETTIVGKLRYTAGSGFSRIQVAVAKGKDAS